MFPFALCFEDCQVADSGTIGFLKRLGENIKRSRIFLGLSVKTEKIEKTKDLKLLINSLSNKDWFERIRLDRFSSEETKNFLRSKLAGSEPPKEIAQYLYHHTSGNPLFLIETLKFLIQKGLIGFKKGEWLFDLENLEKQEIPKEVGNVLLDNLGRYDQNTKKFLEYASLIGQRFDLESTKFLSGLSDDQVFEILFVLLRDEVVHKITEQAELTYEFSSQSLKRLLYDKFNTSQRKKLHLKLADFLEDKEKHGIPQPKEVLAFHYVNSTDYQKAYKYSLESAEETKKRFAHTQTLMHINNALKSTQKVKDQKKYLDALMKRGDFYNSVGELDKALRDYKEILGKAKGVKDERFMATLYKNMSDAYRVKADYENTLAYSKKALDLFTDLKDDLERANTLNIIGGIYLVSSQYDKALKAFAEALRTKKTFNDQRSIALTLSNIGLVHLFKNDYERAKDSFGQYLDIVRKLGLKTEIALGLNNLSLVSYSLGEFNAGISYLLESLESSNQIGDEKGICYNYENLGQNFLEIGDYKKSLEHSDKAMSLAQAIGLPRLGEISLNIAHAYLETGKYEKSTEALGDSLKFAKQTGERNLVASIVLNWAKLCMVLNAKEKQKKLLTDVLKIASELKDDKLFSEVYELLGITKLKEGRPEEGLDYLKKSEELVEKLKLNNKRLSLNVNFHETYSNLNQPKKAEKYLEEARELAESTQSKPLKAEFYLKSAQHWLKQGDSDKSLSDLKKSLQISEEIGKPELIWRIHRLWGKLNMAKGDLESAYKQLQKASEILKGLANNIKNESLRRNYLDDEEKKELFEDIRKVATLMVGEKV